MKKRALTGGKGHLPGMGDSDRSRTIPEGWIFKPKVRRGSDASHYFCPATGQIFPTYKALMHYVEYAKKAQVSIYAPDFGADKLSGNRKGRLHTGTQVCKPASRGKVRIKGTKAASAALEQFPSDVGQITVPKSGISGQFPPISWEEACLPDSKDVSPGIGSKVTSQRTEAGSAALKLLNEFSPGDNHSKGLESTCGVEYPPKRPREGYLQLTPAVDPSIWSTPTREKIPPRRMNHCRPATNHFSFGQSSNLGAINESVGNIDLMDMTPSRDFGGVQQYTPLEGGSSETNYDWAFEANIFPFHAAMEAGEKPTISALDRAQGFQYYMEPSRPKIEYQYYRRNERNKSTRPTVGQLRKKAT